LLHQKQLKPQINNRAKQIVVEEIIDFPAEKICPMNSN